MKKKNCDTCKNIFRINALQKYKKKLICKRCKIREEKKKGFVSTRDIKLEEQKKRIVKTKINPKKIKTNEKETEPKIPGSKVRKKFNRNFSMALSFDESRFLLRKHMNLGLEFEDAKKKVNEDKDFLKEFVKEMRDKNKSDEEINIRFKEEFAKLCEK